MKRQRLGQHFLNSTAVAETIVSEARITKSDTVFELGTGLGILTPLLCERAGIVISAEVDPELARDAELVFSRIDNLVLRSGDGLWAPDEFSIFVSNLPYSRSRDTVEWLATTWFSHGVIMVQKEFAEKMVAMAPERRAISVIARHSLEIRTILRVNKDRFSPPPKIDSVILGIVKKNTMSLDQIKTVNKIFSYKRKTVRNILRQFGIEDQTDKRLDDLSEDEIVDLANKILEK